LKDRILVLAPPFLARRGVVFSKLEQVAEYWNRSWDFRNALDMRYIRAIGPLKKMSASSRVSNGVKAYRIKHIDQADEDNPSNVDTVLAEDIGIERLHLRRVLKANVSLVDSEAEFSNVLKLSWAAKSSFLINARCSASEIAGGCERRRVRRAVIGSMSNREYQWAETHHNATCDSHTCATCTMLPNWKVDGASRSILSVCTCRAHYLSDSLR
jgi:hypothetical protein